MKRFRLELLINENGGVNARSKLKWNHYSTKDQKIFERTFSLQEMVEITQLSQICKRDCNLQYWIFYHLWTTECVKDVKCDSIDNNMCESFNAWILGPRHKTIITMLEDIRVKVMTRIGQMSQFADTWLTNISPMALRVLENNIEKSMKCNNEFNRERGFEVTDGPYQHIVDVRNKTCSCKAWMLKGIPCQHAIATMFYKKWEPIDFVDNCYSKENYLRTYCHFLQPVANMKMWPDSTNPHVEPPVVKPIPGRPQKVRRKEAGETKKNGKMLRKGVIMTCTNCHGKNHNKRDCPFKDHAEGPTNVAGNSTAGPSTYEGPSNVAGHNNSASTSNVAGSSNAAGLSNVSFVATRPRGRPRKHTSPSNVPIGPSMARGRPRKQTNTSEGLNNVPDGPLSARGRQKKIATSEVLADHVRGRGRPRKAPVGGMSMPMPRRTSFAECFKNSTSYDPPVVPIPAVASQSSAKSTNAPSSSNAPNEAPTKRPRTVGMDVFVAEDGFTTYNQGLASGRIIHIGSTEPIMSTTVTGDLGYKPRTGVRWKGKAAVTTSQLEEMRVKKRNSLRSSRSKEPSK